MQDFNQILSAISLNHLTEEQKFKFLLRLEQIGIHDPVRTSHHFVINLRLTVRDYDVKQVLSDIWLIFHSEYLYDVKVRAKLVDQSVSENFYRPMNVDLVEKDIENDRAYENFCAGNLSLVHHLLDLSKCIQLLLVVLVAQNLVEFLLFSQVLQ